MEEFTEKDRRKIENELKELAPEGATCELEKFKGGLKFMHCRAKQEMIELSKIKEMKEDIGADIVFVSAPRALEIGIDFYK